jgi:hypothetical protein
VRPDVGRRLPQKAAGSLVLASLIVFAMRAVARNAATFHESRYSLMGFLLRSSAVCGGDAKPTIDAAFGLVSSPEFMAMNKGYPQTTQKWMGEGAANFNNAVMTDGVGGSLRARRECARQDRTSHQIGSLISADRVLGRDCPQCYQRGSLNPVARLKSAMNVTPIWLREHLSADWPTAARAQAWGLVRGRVRRALSHHPVSL